MKTFKKISAIALTLILTLTMAVMPVSADTGKPIPKSVASGQNFTLMVDADGNIWACGNNEWAQFGTGTDDTDGSARIIKTPFTNVKKVSASNGLSPYDGGIMNNQEDKSSGHGMALLENGDLYVFGNNGLWQHGRGNDDYSTHEEPYQVMRNVKTMGCGATSSYALTNDGVLYEWGVIVSRAGGRQLALGKPAEVCRDVKDMAVGENQVIFIKNDGTVWGFGAQDKYALGNGKSKGITTAPVKILDKKCKSVAVGKCHGLAVTEKGSLYGWGWNVAGQVRSYKKGEFVKKPVYLRGSVKSVSACDRASYYIKTDNTLWGMGNNYDYQMTGTNSETSRVKPVKILSNVKMVSAGYKHAFAIQRDGDMYAWGNNFNNQLGIGAHGLPYYNKSVNKYTYHALSSKPKLAGLSAKKWTAPKFTNIEKVSSTKVKLNWTSVANAQGYEIVGVVNRTLDKQQEYVPYIIKKVSLKGRTYTTFNPKEKKFSTGEQMDFVGYRIRAYKKVNRTTYYTNWSDIYFADVI